MQVAELEPLYARYPAGLLEALPPAEDLRRGPVCRGARAHVALGRS